MFEAVFLNGTVGAGKTTTAVALSDLLRSRREPHGLVDLDQIRLVFPSPADDPFQHEVELANLRSIAATYRAAGARKLVVAGVLELSSEVPRYAAALGVQALGVQAFGVQAPGVGALLVCRLLVDTGTARERLRRRHADDQHELSWHLHRTDQLSAMLNRADVDDVQVDTAGCTPREVAREVGRLAGWFTAADDI